ncbi:gastrin/cholecystokinin type B receptor-like [Hetaerina americana]|uniref:gastrin/cholecystokinin type B receptor-like n=1 Tax=Hetaerina americana TaxID=62018 RepID=UPI003A7F384E
MAKLFSYTWTMGVFLCKFVYYMQNVSTICSVLTLTAISLERYYAIVHPMKAKYTCTVGQATKIVLGIWVASLLLAVPILFVQVHMSVGVKISAFWCFRDLDNVKLWQFHEVYLLILILVVPTCVMASAYASICWEIWKVMRRRYAMTCGRKGINPPLDDPLGNGGSSETSRVTESIRLSGGKKSSRRFRAPRRMNTETSEMESGTVRKVIKMLLTVVVLFVICWAPVLIDNVLKAYDVLPVLRDSNSSLRHMGNAFHLMSYFNSCINPIVYGFMSKSFRVSFYKVLCKCCHQGMGTSSKPKRNPSTNSQSRTTSVRYTETSSGRSMSMTTTY